MPSLSTTQARINELSSIIHQYNHSYYSSISSESNLLACNDETYDSLVSELKELEKQYPEFRLEDSPTIFVRGKQNTAFTTRTHNTPMLSLNNIYSFDELFDSFSHNFSPHRALPLMGKLYVIHLSKTNW